MRSDVKIGDKYLTKDYGFLFSSKNISSPKPKLIEIDIPGTSEMIDLTETLSGDVEYDQREITVVVKDIIGVHSYYARLSQLANDIHGQKKELIFSKDSGYYWTGRMDVNTAVAETYGSTFTIKATVDPYKYETQSSLEPWLWDSFSFEDGIIRDYFNIAVPGSITIIGRRKRVCPKFICSNAMNVSYLGNIYPLASGETVVPDIFIGEGNHVLTFIGSGTVSVDYQGGSL